MKTVEKSRELIRVWNKFMVLCQELEVDSERMIWAGKTYLAAEVGLDITDPVWDEVDVRVLSR